MPLRAQPGLRFVERRQAEFEALAAAADGRRQARGVGTDQPQVAAGLRLFECLQQRVAGGVVDRIGRVDDGDLRAAVLRGQGELFRELADLFDHDLGARLVGLVVDLVADQQQVGMAGMAERMRGRTVGPHFQRVALHAMREQQAAAAASAGVVTGRAGFAQQAPREAFGERALAQVRGAAEQQAMAEAAAVERGDGLVVDALLPGRERGQFEVHANRLMQTRRDR